MSELTRVEEICNKLIETSPDVIRLMRRLIEKISDCTFIENQLMNEFEAALYQGGVPPGMVPSLSQMKARSIVTNIRLVLIQQGDSIVVYFLCKTVQSLYSLGQMIVSGFMHAVFAVAIESLARTTVDVYVKAEEFNLRLLCLSAPQDKGWSVNPWNY